METKHNDELAQLKSQFEHVLAETAEELNTLIQKYTTEKANLMNELDGKSSVYRNTTAVSYTHLDVYKRQQCGGRPAKHDQHPQGANWRTGSASRRAEARDNHNS